MSTIDPKWIQYDEDKLTTIDKAGKKELSLREDIIIDASVTRINDSKIEIRTVSEGEPTSPSAKDFYIEVPDTL